MGIFSQLTSVLGLGKKQVNILVVGLDNSGKSTILNYMKPSEVQSTHLVPTVGFNIDKFTSNRLNFVAFDMSGQGRYRNLWETYYKETEAIVFVVDSSDHLRIAVARDELWLMLDHKDLATKQIPLLIFANKMDEKGSLVASEVSRYMGLDLIRNRNWYICASCAITGEGLPQGFEWLAQNVRNECKKQNF